MSASTVKSVPWFSIVFGILAILVFLFILVVTYLPNQPVSIDHQLKQERLEQAGRGPMAGRPAHHCAPARQQKAGGRSRSSFNVECAEGFSGIPMESGSGSFSACGVLPTSA